MGTAVEAFMSVRTIHEVELAWWWRDKELHDRDYHIKVNDSMYAKVRELGGKYNVSHDTRYCCQWEGVQLLSEDKAAAEAAGRELARHLARFKGVVPLNT